MPESFFDEYVEGWNSPDGTKLASLMAADGTYEDVTIGRVMDRSEVVGFISRIRAWSSDYVVELVSTQRDGIDYAMEWVRTGTQNGPAPGLGLLVATGKPYRIRGASIGQLDQAGKIKLHHDYWNLASFLIQLGALPRVPAADEPK